MTLEKKLKNATLNFALDIILKRSKKSPERCARNMIELGILNFPESVEKMNKEVLYKKFLNSCKSLELSQIKIVFFDIFK